MGKGGQEPFFVVSRREQMKQGKQFRIGGFEWFLCLHGIGAATNCLAPGPEGIRAVGERPRV